MSEIPSKVSDLDPQSLILKIEEFYYRGELNNEIYIRRAISALYFSLFNYWSAIMYNFGKRGKGPQQDSWSHTEFFNFLLSHGLESKIYPLHVLRVAVDHYTLNPAKIKLFGNLKISNRSKELECSINPKTLEKAINFAKEIKDFLSKISKSEL